jgi:predicted transcriptional regulator
MVDTSEFFDAVQAATQIVSAFVSHNSLPAADLPALMQSVHAALVKIVRDEAPPAQPVIATPATSIRKSITPDYLVCLDDGRRFKSLKRHLTQLGMTPDQYRKKWNLPADYPMVAANYAAQRSQLAKQIGLGQIRNRNAKATGRPRRGRSSKTTVETVTT